MKKLEKIMLINPTTLNAFDKIRESFNNMEVDLLIAINAPIKPRMKPTNSTLGAYWKATEGKRVSKKKA